MVKIDAEKCIGCGLCVAECVNGRLYLQNEKVQLQDEGCNNCGHCAAICPAAAIEIADYPQDAIEYDTASFNVIPQNLLNIIRYRRSMRHYSEKKVEEDILRQIIEAGRFMPTAMNLQDVKYTVVQDKLPEIKKLAWSGLERYIEEIECNDDSPVGEKNLLPYMKNIYYRHQMGELRDVLFHNAPVLLILSAKMTVNAFLAAAIELMANACGLSCLFNGFVERALKGSEDALNILALDKKDICITMLLGYPGRKFQRTAVRKPADIQWS